MLNRPALEAHGDRERGEDERRRNRENLPEARGVTERVGEDRPVDVDRALAVEDDDDGADHERDHEGEQQRALHEQRLEPLGRSRARATGIVTSGEAT